MSGEDRGRLRTAQRAARQAVWFERLKALVTGFVVFDIIMVVWILNHWSRVTG